MSYQISIGQGEYARLRRAKAILDERDRQDDKWGPQDHSLYKWNTILMEEVGELATACLEYYDKPCEEAAEAWRKEAVQVAAVALAMMEQYIDHCFPWPSTEAEAAQEDVGNE